MSRNGEFTVNIGLVADGVPVAGAVYAPVLERLWSGGATARLRRDRARRRPGRGRRGPPASAPARRRPSGWTALASRSHGDAETEALLARLPVASAAPPARP